MRKLGEAEVDELLGGQVVGRIGCHADGLTYVVPVIYARSGDGIYVASVDGQKIRMMRRNPNVCFEVDEYDGAGSWRSVIVQGVYEELTGADAEAALTVLAERFGKKPGEGRRLAGPDTVCFRIAIGDATGRAVER